MTLNHHKKQLGVVKMEFAIFIQKDEGSVYGVAIPDVAGCFSSGESIEEAIKNASEAISAHFELLLESGERLNLASSKIEDLMKDPEYQDGGIWALAHVDMSKLDTKPERINISVPHFALCKIDEHIESRHETRSGFLIRAAFNQIANESVSHAA
jgi:predicted RNase H-like HicB family nuclease